MNAEENKEKRRAMDLALYRLSRSACTEHGMQVYLKKKDISEESIAYAMQRVIEYGYINDEEYAVNYVRSAMAKGMSARMMIYKLMQKGINREQAETAAEAVDGESQHASALALARKYYARLRDAEERKKLYKTSRYLYSKGFDQDTIQSVIGEIAGDENG